ncbi:MAG: hypothetical protein D6679_01425, partial [Candidatus Hydrogenedentota bacterium]
GQAQRQKGEGSSTGAKAGVGAEKDATALVLVRVRPVEDAGASIGGPAMEGRMPSSALPRRGNA